jgi:purine-nucleoside phosphorylase
MTPSHNFQEAIDVLRKTAPGGVDLAVVLGSGLSDAVGMLRGAEHISAGTLPGYPRAGVAGHAGIISLAAVGKLRLIVFRGRTHIYERGSVPEVLAPVHVAYGLGARWIVLTNASGGIRSSFVPGDVMLIEDHLNFTFRALPHSAQEISRRRSGIYDRALLEVAREEARKQGITLHQGVYAGVLGPSYETASEIAMLLRVGADAVGMSTVLEAEEAGR